MLGWLREFCFSILIYPKPNPWIGYTSFDLSLLLSFVVFGLLLFLGGPSACIERRFLKGVIARLRWACPNYLKGVYLNLSPIEADHRCSRKQLFFILSFFVLQYIHLNILVSATLIFCLYCFLIDQHTAL